VAYYKRLGVTVTRVMTDNGSCYKALRLSPMIGALLPIADASLQPRKDTLRSFGGALSLVI
jgi:hypothetical protein